MAAYDIFISFHDVDPDAAMAESLYHALRAKGYHPFFSKYSFDQDGNPDFSNAIEEALESAKLLIAVGSSRQNLSAKWIKHEINLFAILTMEAEQNDRNMISYRVPEFPIEELPMKLKAQQSFVEQEKLLVMVDSFMQRGAASGENAGQPSVPEPEAKDGETDAARAQTNPAQPSVPEQEAKDGETDAAQMPTQSKKRPWPHYLLIAASILVALVGIVAILTRILPKWDFYNYSMGKLLTKQGSYEKAYRHLYQCKGYKDTEILLEDFYLLCGKTTRMDADGISYLYGEEEYDSKRHQIIQISYQRDGSQSSKSINGYDGNGNQTSRIVYGSDGKMAHKFEYTYDADGNRTSYIWYNSDGKISEKSECTYDADGNLTSYIWYGSDGKMTDKCEYIYDADGNHTSRIVYGSDGKMSEKSEFTCDADGNTTSWIVYDSDGKMLEKYEYTYDADGNRTSEIWYDSDGKMYQKFEYTYDADGNQTSRIRYDSDGIMDSKYTYKYDERGNLIKENCYNGDDETPVQFKYEDYEVVYLPIDRD